MISLIKNELKKIFSKKAIYIVLIITIGFCILSNVMQKKSRENIYYSYMNYGREPEEDIVVYEDNLELAKEDGDTESIIIFESKIEKIKIMDEYDSKSWQQNFGEQLETAIENLKRATNETDKEKYQKEYDEILKNFEENNWKPCAQRELEKIKQEVAELDDGEEKHSKEDEIQILEWRIEKNIPYEESDLNTYLQTWAMEKMMLRHIDSDSYRTENEKKEQRKECNATIAICEYAIENKLNTNISKDIGTQGILSTTAKSQLLYVFSQYGFFIILAIVIIAGTIVSEEFNKGTIKLLLVRPYKRTKILLAKFITCLIILLGSYITLAVTQTIVGGIVYGFNSYSDPTIMYNFNTNSIEHVGNIQYVIMSGLSILPQYLLLMTLAFAIGTIATNSPIAIAIPCIGSFVADIINSLAFNFKKARFLLYFVTPNWDLNIYAFGNKPTMPELSLPFSISICVIYFAIMLWASIIVFKRRDIKNI